MFDPNYHGVTYIVCGSVEILIIFLGVLPFFLSFHKYSSHFLYHYHPRLEKTGHHLCLRHAGWIVHLAFSPNFGA